MTIEKTETRRDVVRYSLVIDDEYVERMNECLKEYGFSEFKITLDDIIDVAKGEETERLDVNFIHYYNENHEWPCRLYDTLSEWIDEDIHDSDMVEYLDSETDWVDVKVLDY